MRHHDRFLAVCKHSAIVALMLVIAASAHADTSFLIGAGPDIGLFDVGDGHKNPGLQARAMLHLGQGEGRTSFRLDFAYTRFWADGEQNEDYDAIAFFANLVLRLGSASGSYPYWTLGAGYDRYWDTDIPELQNDTGGVIFGTGFGLHLGWGNIEARFDLAGANEDIGAHVPIFVALRF